MKKKAYIIEGIICKRDGNAPANIESELLKLIDVANDFLIKIERSCILERVQFPHNITYLLGYYNDDKLLFFCYSTLYIPIKLHTIPTKILTH